ncbi:MAG: hypothetical protein WC610_00935 [Patescibacteria group bacterium]
MQDIIQPMFDFGRLPEDTLRLVSYCPVCHCHYNPLEAKILDENETAHLIYVKCGRCKSAIVALILANSFGVSSVGLITDLDSQEVNKFRESAKINSDELLGVYEALKSGEPERDLNLI